MRDTLTDACMWREAHTMHTHLICPDCGHETVTDGYASHWRCQACDNVNAQAIVLCRGDGTIRAPYSPPPSSD